MRRGSLKALTAGKKAAETRKRNKLLNGVAPKRKGRNMLVTKLKFQKLKEGDYHKLEIKIPMDIFIHKKMNRMYLSPSRTKII